MEGLESRVQGEAFSKTNYLFFPPASKLMKFLAMVTVVIFAALAYMWLLVFLWWPLSMAWGLCPDSFWPHGLWHLWQVAMWHFSQPISENHTLDLLMKADSIWHSTLIILGLRYLDHKISPGLMWRPWIAGPIQLLLSFFDTHTHGIQNASGSQGKYTNQQMAPNVQNSKYPLVN